MADHSNLNDIQRGDGVSARGLLITAVILVAIIAAIAFLGGNGEPTTGEQGVAPTAAQPIAPATAD